MAVSIDPATKVINVPRLDLTLIQSNPTEIREMDLNWFRLTLMDLIDDADRIWMDTTHTHQAPLLIGGVTLARVIELINGYTVTFEDGQYAVNIVGGNSNVGDNINVNQVSVRSANSAGLVQTSVSGLTTQEALDLATTRKIMQNKMITDPITGKQTVYEDDNVSIFIEGNLFEDAAGTQAYRGQGAERREKLE